MIGATGLAGPSYHNNLGRGGQNRTAAQTPPVLRRTQQEQDKKDLQTESQALQNQLLLLKSESDGAAASEETQKKLEEQIEKINAQLQAAAAQGTGGDAAAQAAQLRRRFDSYEPKAEAQPAGLYEVSHDENGSPVIKTGRPAEDAAPGMAQSEPEETPGSGEDSPSATKTTVNTDRVDREIAQLKQSKRQLEQQVAAAEIGRAHV